MKRGIILYGPPASGKDTVTRELLAVGSTYALFRRLKVGPGRTAGYRMATIGDIDALRKRREIVWENRRYESIYVVDLPALTRQLDKGVPIVHLGQPEAVTAVKAATPTVHWLAVYLWCPRDVAASRAQDRATGDLDARLAAWDQTVPLTTADLTINTAEVSAADAAARIHSRLPCFGD